MSHEILARLAAPFPADVVSWRVGSTNSDKTKGMALAYVDSRDVQRRFDEVMGADWQDELVVQSNGLVTCRIGLYIDGQWRWRQDGTAAIRESYGADGKPLSIKDEQAREMEQKGASSDAFKRCAVKWSVGRYLYDMPSPWVAINQYKQIADGELPKLRALAAKAAGGAPVAGNAGNQRETETVSEKPAQQSAYAARKDGAYQRIESEIRRFEAERVTTAAFVEYLGKQASLIKTWPDGWQQSIRAEADRVLGVLRAHHAPTPLMAAE